MQPQVSHPLVAIVGPTAAGKSELALRLAQRFGGEIVNADSRLVYRGMDVGTGKPSPAELANVAHHIVDVVDPDETYNLALYLEEANGAIRGVDSRGRLPLLVGGTGQYVWALLEGFSAPQVPPSPSLRERLETQARDEGHDALWARLREVDPESAGRIDPRNVRRVVRALEVTLESGVPFSQARKRERPPYRSLVIGLTIERAELYRRIDRRVEGMITAGWLGEAARLQGSGYLPDLPAMGAIGYREMAAYVTGKLSLEEATLRIKGATHRFARRQYAWFRLSDPRISWLDAASPDTFEAAAALVDSHLAATGADS